MASVTRTRSCHCHAIYMHHSVIFSIFRVSFMEAISWRRLATWRTPPSHRRSIDAGVSCGVFCIDCLVQTGPCTYHRPSSGRELLIVLRQHPPALSLSSWLYSIVILLPTPLSAIFKARLPQVGADLGVLIGAVGHVTRPSGKIRGRVAHLPPAQALPRTTHSSK